MTLSATEVHHLKQAPTDEEVLPVVRTRWSPRSFSDRQVSAADLRKVFEAARWAPSSFNEQPWRFLLGVRGSDAYQKIASALGEFNQSWALSAPVLILGAAKTRFTHNHAENIYGYFDLGAASGFITLQAAALGLHTHQMAGFDHDAARRAFQIPEEYVLGSVIALGYQGEPSALSKEQMVAQETAPRSRKSLSEIVFSAWGKPATLD
ncbi:MAG TPA: nitroreductase family protein [Terracidiphilus sp.]|nr:nitroreductase family protein [Terracidiphilus sp.]